MSDRRKKARMMSESDFDDDIVTLRFIMNGKVIHSNEKSKCHFEQ